MERSRPQRCLWIAGGLLALGAASTAQDCAVLSEQKISGTAGGFTGSLDNSDNFGRSAAALGDLDGDGVEDLAVGAPFDDDGASNQGAVWILFLNGDGTVKAHQKISESAGGFAGDLDAADHFGFAVSALGDLDADGIGDLAVGAHGDDDGASTRGAVWILFLNANGTVKQEQKISDTEGGFTGSLNTGDNFGFAVASLGDLDGDGTGDLAVGARLDDDGGADRGAVWILFLHADGTVKGHQKISDTQGGFLGDLDDGDEFGWAAASPGDVDGDGLADVAVGVQLDDDGGPERGAVWILFLNADGTVRNEQKISHTQGGFGGTLDDDDRFGWSLSAPGDYDGDGTVDVAAGAVGDDDGGDRRGALWLLLLNADGTVKDEHKISDTAGGFGGVLENSDQLGSSAAPVGDLDGDGAPNLAVGAWLDDDGGENRGAVWKLSLGHGSSEVTRLGIPPNPNAFLPGATSGPVIGATWDPFLDHTTFQPAAILDFVGIGVTPTNIPSGFGTILCGVAPPIVVTSPPGVPFVLPIPNDCVHVGKTVCTQAGSIDGVLTIELANALDVTIGTV